MLGEFFADERSYYKKATGYASASLAMQRNLFEGEREAMWKDYFLLGKIHYVNNNKAQAQ